MTLGPLMVDVAGLALAPDEVERLRSPVVGGVILFTRNFCDRDQLRELVREIHAVRTPPLLVAVDQEGGRVQRFRGEFQALPSLRWIGRQYDLDPEAGRRLASACAFVMATELLDVGIDLSFAPVLDLDYGRSEVIGDRSFHSSAETVVRLARAYGQGLRAAGMVPIGKHFPGHGFVVADSHQELPVDRRTHAELYDDLTPYRELAREQLAGVMVGHIRFPEIDPDVASLSSGWIRTELRGNLGFRGVVFTDDLSMRALSFVGDPGARARLALDAGADMALVCNDPEGAARAIADLSGYRDPAAQARLIALRPHRHPGSLPIREQRGYRDALALLSAALAAPPLSLE